MNQRRLVWLLVVMVSLLALRWWNPPAADGPTEVAQAIVRPVARSAAASASGTKVSRSENLAAGQATSLENLSAGTRGIEMADAPRNAFAVRTPPPTPAPLPPQPVRVAALPPPVVAPPMPVPPSPPPPPLPPLQVIGSWRDTQGASVFLGGPRGVLQGRVGDVLLSEYRIEQITPQQVLLKHLPSGRDIPLAVPTNAAPSLALAK